MLRRAGSGSVGTNSNRHGTRCARAVTSPTYRASQHCRLLQVAHHGVSSLQEVVRFMPSQPRPCAHGDHRTPLQVQLLDSTLVHPCCPLTASQRGLYVPGGGEPLHSFSVACSSDRYWTDADLLRSAVPTRVRAALAFTEVTCGTRPGVRCRMSDCRATDGQVSRAVSLC